MSSRKELSENNLDIFLSFCRIASSAPPSAPPVRVVVSSLHSDKNPAKICPTYFPTIPYLWYGSFFIILKARYICSRRMSLIS